MLPPSGTSVFDPLRRAFWFFLALAGSGRGERARADRVDDQDRAVGEGDPVERGRAEQVGGRRERRPPGPRAPGPGTPGAGVHRERPGRTPRRSRSRHGRSVAASWPSMIPRGSRLSSLVRVQPQGSRMVPRATGTSVSEPARTNPPAGRTPRSNRWPLALRSRATGRRAARCGRASRPDRRRITASRRPRRPA